ncbi:hypothetical protein [Clostridium sp.]|uniref:hypothetical protein n=1 Tax=Clostridium sp. TaxID=1506 RepID=UPI002609B18A|nr:hypothetical protein [Clostridium sp.]
MDLMDVFLGFIGIYLVIASYYVIKKGKLILLAVGYTYIEGRKVNNIKRLEKDLSKSSKFFGRALIITFIIKIVNINNIAIITNIIGIFEWIFIIKYCIEMFIINTNIRKEKYE